MHFSILINGSYKGFFRSSRGLRQGDPLSPTLFIMVTEALRLLLLKVTDFCLISGCKIEHSSLQFHHLQFADDTIIFCEADEENVGIEVVRAVLFFANQLS